MSKQPFLTFSELKKLTGETNPRQQVAVLHQHGLNPFINQTTGQAVIYREAVMKSMCRSEASMDDTTFINWDAEHDQGKRL